MTQIINFTRPYDPRPQVEASTRICDLTAELADTLTKNVVLKALGDRLISLASSELAKPDLAQLAADIRFLETHRNRLDDIVKQARRVLESHGNQRS